MIECVTLERNHYFSGNPICSQHKLRYKSIIRRQKWDVPFVRDMEFDCYDNPAAHYLVKRNQAGEAIGVSRLYPTDRPYMLEEHFPHLITKIPVPKNQQVWETTRFCVDDALPPSERKRILQELVVGHLEFALQQKIKKIVAVTYPALWKTIFINSGWDVEWLGNVHKTNEGLKIIAGSLFVSEAVLQNVRKMTRIDQRVLTYGFKKDVQQAAA